MSKDILRSLLYPDPVTETINGTEVTFNFRLPLQSEAVKLRRDIQNASKKDADEFIDLFYSGPLQLAAMWGDGERFTREEASHLTTLLPPDSQLVTQCLKLCGLDKVEAQIKAGLKKSAEERERQQKKGANTEDDSPLE